MIACLHAFRYIHEHDEEEWSLWTVVCEAATTADTGAGEIVA